MRLLTKNKGFSIVEVMVAILVIFITMLFGLSFFSFGHKDIAKGKHVTYAVQLAKDEIEVIKAAQYPYIPVTGNTTFIKYGVNFLCSYGSNEIANDVEQYKIIFVTVTWTADSVPQMISLHTIVTK